jgi:hypothetical protein
MMPLQRHADCPAIFAALHPNRVDSAPGDFADDRAGKGLTVSHS